MSTQVTTAFSQQFSSNVYLLAQQKALNSAQQYVRNLSPAKRRFSIKSVKQRQSQRRAVTLNSWSVSRQRLTDNPVNSVEPLTR